MLVQFKPKLKRSFNVTMATAMTLFYKKSVIDNINVIYILRLADHCLAVIAAS